MKSDLFTKMAGPFTAGAIVIFNHLVPGGVDLVIASLHKCAPTAPVTPPPPHPCPTITFYQNPHDRSHSHTSAPPPPLAPCERQVPHQDIHAMLTPPPASYHLPQSSIQTDACLSSVEGSLGEIHCTGNGVNNCDPLFHFN